MQRESARILQLIGISSVSLFLEMALIRFINSTVQVIAYFNNFVILAAFLGLGFGALLVGRVQKLFARFPFVLASVLIVVVLLDRLTAVSQDQQDLVAWTVANAPIQLPTGVVVATIFVGCFAVFAPLGWKLGTCIDAFEDRLEAYGYDLLGSICGVLAFGAMSWFGTAPWIWFGLAACVIAWLLHSEGSELKLRGVLLLAVVAISALSSDGYYSPYYKIQLQSFWRKGSPTPTYYSVLVDKLRIQDAIDFSQDLRGTPVESWTAYYQLPYKIQKPGSVLVLGGGSGNDTAMALKAGATHVDVVEVDPILVRFGHELHAQKPYSDPRVRAINDDARAFLRRGTDPYDMIVMNALDSHHQLPGLSTLRLESYIYTVQAFEDVRRHMRADSFFIVHLASTRPWMAERLYWSLAKAFGKEPALVTTADSPFHSIAFVFGPSSVIDRARSESNGLLWGGKVNFAEARDRVALATDDWPHLYLADRKIPTIYLQVLAFILLAALVSFRAVGVGKPTARNLHFMLLGGAFMLLETRAITQFALLFGSTWVVNAIVVTSILCVIYAGNRLVWKGLQLPKPLVYAALLASLFGLYFLRLDMLLPLQPALRVLAAGLVVGTPVFLASLVFSDSFRSAPSGAEAFGANLVGVVLGGALEYSSMLLGLKTLYLIALAIYALAWLAERRQSASA